MKRHKGKTVVTLVSVEPATGTLRRYVAGDGPTVMTHEATVGRPATFTGEVIAEFRDHPSDRFRMELPSPPPLPPVGGTPVAMRMAA